MPPLVAPDFHDVAWRGLPPPGTWTHLSMRYETVELGCPPVLGFVYWDADIARWRRFAAVVRSDAEDPSLRPSADQESPSSWSTQLEAPGASPHSSQPIPEPAEEPTSIPPQAITEGRARAAATAAAATAGNNSSVGPHIPLEEPRSIPPRAIIEHRARIAAAAAAAPSADTIFQFFRRPGPYVREPPSATWTAEEHAAQGGGQPSGSAGASTAHWMPWPHGAISGSSNERQGAGEWAARRPGRVWGPLPGDPWKDSYGWMEADQAPSPPGFPPPGSPPRV